AVLANLLNPDVIVLAGYYVPLAPWPAARAEKEMRSRAVAPGGGGCRLEVSTLGYGAAALGAAARVLDSVDSGRLPAPASPARRGAGLDRSHLTGHSSG